MIDFQPGDIVRLKSGGPAMTVEQVAEQLHGGIGVWCVWFEMTSKERKSARDTFAPVLLVKVEPHAPSPPLKLAFS